MKCPAMKMLLIDLKLIYIIINMTKFRLLGEESFHRCLVDTMWSASETYR